jgi:hypothetical protein
MKIAVFGAGAVGGHVAARLGAGAEATGIEVSAVARGAQLAAIAERGITLWIGAERYCARLRVAAEPWRLQSTIGSSILPSLHLQRISSKSLARRLCRLDWASLTLWFCSMNPSRSVSPRATRPTFCSKSAANLPLRIGAALWCSERSCDICDCVSDIPCLRSLQSSVLFLARMHYHTKLWQF